MPVRLDHKKAEDYVRNGGYSRLSKLANDPDFQTLAEEFYRLNGRVPEEGLTASQSLIVAVTTMADTGFDSREQPFDEKWGLEDHLRELSKSFVGLPDPEVLEQVFADIAEAHAQDALADRLDKLDAEVPQALPDLSPKQQARVEQENSLRADLVAAAGLWEPPKFKPDTALQTDLAIAHAAQRDEDPADTIDPEARGVEQWAEENSPPPEDDSMTADFRRATEGLNFEPDHTQTT